MRTLFLIAICIMVMQACSTAPEPGLVDETIYVRHQGADMPAYVHGNLESNVFLITLHGAGSFGLSFRSDQFQEVLERNQVVVYFDQRGEGMAQGHYGKPDDLIDLMASDVEALISVLKHKYGEDITLFMMGHSWGGLLSGTTLLRPGVQAQISGWINVSGLLDLLDVNRNRVELMQEIASVQVNKGKQVEAWESVYDRLEVLDFSTDQGNNELLGIVAEANVLIAEDEEIFTGVGRENLRQTIIKNNPITWQFSHLFHQPVQYARENDYSITNQLDQISIPTLFIYGLYDFSAPLNMGLDAYDNIDSRNKEFKVYNSSMHHPFDSEREVFTIDIQQFINRFK